jgi:beta-N-acetylhexosaminidase
MIVGFDGTSLNGDLKFLIGELGVAGVILFARNIESPDQVRVFTRSLQDYARECGMPPLIVSIDQEGGTVARLKDPFPQFPLGNPGMETTADAESYAELTALGLLDVGVNMNMAPVMDVEPDRKSVV